LAYWTLHDVQHLPGVPERDLSAFERQYSVRLPSSVRELYRLTDGTNVPGSSGQDHRAFHFWSLQAVVRDDDFPWLFPFLDYRETSWRYAIDLAGRGATQYGAIYILSAKPLIVANTFDELAELYVSESSSIYLQRG
jgi:hypothetical protein